MVTRERIGRPPNGPMHGRTGPVISTNGPGRAHTDADNGGTGAVSSETDAGGTRPDAASSGADAAMTERMRQLANKVSWVDTNPWDNRTGRRDSVRRRLWAERSGRGACRRCCA